MDLFIIILINPNNTQQEQPNNMSSLVEASEIAFKEIDDYETYYKVKAILNKYIVYVRQINGDEQIEIGKLQMTEEQVRETMQKQGIDAINKMLDKQYFQEITIDEENIMLKFNKYKINNENYNLNINNVYEIDLNESITIILVEAELNKQDLNMIVKLDNKNNTFSLYLEDFIEKYNYSKDMNKNQININTYEIEANSFNSKIKVNTSETNIVSQYFVEYKAKMINDAETAYNLLNEDYREKKYGSYEKFENFIKNNKEKILHSSIEKYQVTENNGIKNYICVDKDGKYYIFVEKDITYYEVILDTYTIELPEFLEKYNNNDDEIKCGLNIQKLFDAINDEDYSFVYNKLDNTFRQNNFSSEEVFVKYVEQNLKNKQIGHTKCEKNGEIYIYTMTLTDNNQNSENKTFVMKLLEGTDFVFSFSK